MNNGYNNYNGYDPNNQNQNYGQNGQGYYQQNQGYGPYTPPPIDPMMGGYPPQNPYVMQEAQNKATTAKTFGIVSLVGVFLIPLLAIVFGILAISSANQSRQMLGYSLPDAQTGHTLGMVGVIGFCVIIGLVFFIVIAVTAAL